MLELTSQASVSRDAFPPTPPGPEGSNGNGLLRVQWVAGAWLKSSGFLCTFAFALRLCGQQLLSRRRGEQRSERRENCRAKRIKMNIKRTGIAIGAAVLLGFPAGWIFAMALTPLLWRLEPVLQMELAGHSGPSNWIFYLTWAFVIPGLFFVIRHMLSRSPDKL